VLRTDAGEQLLHAGQCAGFPAGSGDGHQFVNRSDRPALYLEVGSRDEADQVYYPDVDMHYGLPDSPGSSRAATARRTEARGPRRPRAQNRQCSASEALRPGRV